jgi:hypothetical protein
MWLLRNILGSGMAATAALSVPAFFGSCRAGQSLCRKDRQVRERLDEKAIDKMIMDSFPASDPPSTY